LTQLGGSDGIRSRVAWASAAVAVAALAVLLRVPLLTHESGDYRQYLLVWYRTLDREHFHAFATPFSDYSPAYLYLLWGATAIPAGPLLAIKSVSIAFDLILAGACAFLGRTAGLSGVRCLLVFGAILATPTVMLNSASWGQCDAVYGACVVAGIAEITRRRPNSGALAIGLGIAVKAQAAFILPWLLVMTLRSRFSWRSWAWLPVPFLVSIIPPAVLGRSVGDLLTTYVSQGEKYRQLTLGAPTVYAWLDVRQGFGTPGMFLAAAAILAAALAAARWAKLDQRMDLLRLALFFAIFVPFVAPRMHERYFYLADILAVVYAVAVPRRAFVPLFVVAASFFSYLPFLYATNVVPLWALSLAMACALLVVAIDVFMPLSRKSTAAVPDPNRNRAVLPVDGPDVLAPGALRAAPTGENASLGEGRASAG
jgi:Gpi18-like mannosyltransferase